MLIVSNILAYEEHTGLSIFLSDSANLVILVQIIIATRSTSRVYLVDGNKELINVDLIIHASCYM